MTWWGYALLSSACWGMQYLLLETLFRRVPFAAAYSFLSIANGLLVAAVLFCLYPKQDWTQLWQGKRMLGMMVLYLIFGSGAYLFNAYAIRNKDATFPRFSRLPTRSSSSCLLVFSCGNSTSAWSALLGQQ